VTTVLYIRDLSAIYNCSAIYAVVIPLYVGRKELVTQYFDPKMEMTRMRKSTEEKALQRIFNVCPIVVQSELYCAKAPC